MVRAERESALFCRGFRDRTEEARNAEKMPRAVKRAIAATEGRKRGDQRAETVARRVNLVNTTPRRVLQPEIKSGLKALSS